MKRYILTVTENANFDNVVTQVRGAGADVGRTMPTLGVIALQASDEVATQIRQIVGVNSLEIEQIATTQE
jgi:hypothetical protein